jgi:Uma2 family endonuclease
LAELLSIPEPDVAWVKRRRYKRVRPSVDDIGLLIEVADSSLSYDRGEKASLYAEAGIVEYWIANCDDEWIEIHREPRGNAYADCFVVKRGEQISPLVAPDAWLFVSEVFADE